MNRIIAAFLAAVLLVGCSRLNRVHNPGTIEVTGTAQVNVTPDICYVNFAINTRNKSSAAKAYERNADIMKEISAAAGKLGIEPKDIKTVNFTITPEYHWVDDGERRVFDGYLVSHVLQVQVRDLDKVTGVLDAAVAAGAREVQSVLFTVENPKQYLTEARLEAMEAARNKAEAYARMNGTGLGRPLTIRESEPGVAMERYLFANAPQYCFDATATAEAGARLAPGETSLSHTVYVTYELN